MEDASHHTARHGEECRRKVSARSAVKPPAHELLSSHLHGKVDASRVLDVVFFII